MALFSPNMYDLSYICRYERRTRTMTKDTLLQEINRFLEKLDITDLNQVYSYFKDLFSVTQNSGNSHTKTKKLHVNHDKT